MTAGFDERSLLFVSVFFLSFFMHTTNTPARAHSHIHTVCLCKQCVLSTHVWMFWMFVLIFNILIEITAKKVKEIFFKENRTAATKTGQTA